MCKKRKPTGGTGEIHKARPSRFLEESGECRFGTRGTTGTISPKWLRPNWKECQLQALPAEGLPPQNGYLFVLLFLRALFLLVLLSFSFFKRGVVVPPRIGQLFCLRCSSQGPSLQETASPTCWNGIPGDCAPCAPHPLNLCVFFEDTEETAFLSWFCAWIF